MSAISKIQWCDSTVNFWSGCTKVSPGCAHCYAETRDKRMLYERVLHFGKGKPRLKHSGAVANCLAMNRKPWVCDRCGHADDFGHDRFSGNFVRPGNISAQILCEKCGITPGVHRRRIFADSMSDWLDAEVPIAWLAEMLDTIRQCDQVIFILCTKRPENFSRRLHAVLGEVEENGPLFKWVEEWLTEYAVAKDGKSSIGHRASSIPANIWLLTSVENQEMAEKRIPELLKIPAVVRGLSCEPLLGPVDLHNTLPLLDWVIVGGESGPGSRPFQVDWVRRIAGHCFAVRTPCFVKQLGSDIRDRNDAGFDGESRSEWPMDTHYKEIDPAEYQGAPVKILLDDSKGGDMEEWPADLQVREFPESILQKGTKGTKGETSLTSLASVKNK